MSFEALSINGDTHLGGDDFDQVIIDFLADEFKKSEDIDLKSDHGSSAPEEAAEKAKIELFFNSNKLTYHIFQPHPVGQTLVKTNSL